MKLKVFNQSKAVVPEKEIFLKLVQESSSTIALRMCDALGKEVQSPNLLRVVERDGLLEVARALTPNRDYARRCPLGCTYLS